MERLRLFAAALWLGSLAGSALFASMFFSTLDRHLAGDAVSHMMRAETWIAMGCAAVLLLSGAGRSVRWLVVGMLACALTIHYGLQPMMAMLRAAASAGTLTADLKTQFGMLHLASVVFFAAEVVLGMLVLLKVAPRERRGF